MSTEMLKILYHRLIQYKWEKRKDCLILIVPFAMALN